MSLRFWRRIQLLPGVRLNFSARGPSLSLGPRGASVTLGSRGTYANFGIPGSGLSYRTRLKVPRFASDVNGHALGAAPNDVRAPNPSSAFTDADHPVGEYELSLRNLLKDRERGVVDWNERAGWLDVPCPPAEDEAYDKYVFKVAVADFAKRMVEGDKAAWSEVIREELLNERLPFDFAFTWGVDDSTGIIHVEIELPGKDVVAVLSLRTTKERELYEDVCCALVLRFAHEIFRVIPEATDIYLSGYIPSRDPATGRPARSVYLRLMAGRESFSKIDLDYVDPSTAFDGLDGSKRTRRGELIPLEVEPVEQNVVDGAPHQ